MRKFQWMAAALFAAALLCTNVRADDKFWTLDFKHTGLHYITSGGKVYAYTTFEVTNKTGAARNFYPIFRVETDTHQVTYAMPAPEVLDVIRGRHGRNFLDINRISGSLADGETRVGVAVFRNLDPNADHVKVYITGFTDAFRYQDEDARKGYQRMMYKIYWYRPGDADSRLRSPVETKTDEWVWRSTGTAATASDAPTEETVRAPAEGPVKPAAPVEAAPEKPAEAAPEKPVEAAPEKPAEPAPAPAE